MRDTRTIAEYAEHIGYLTKFEDLPVFLVYVGKQCYIYYLDMKTQRICSVALETYEIQNAVHRRNPDDFPNSDWDWLHEAEKRGAELSSSGCLMTKDGQYIRSLIADTYIGKKIGMTF